MADTIGRITVPEIAAVSGAFPFVTDFAHECVIKRQVITHLFANPTGMVEQAFYVGLPATRYTCRRRTLSNTDRAALIQFWADTQGGAAPFTYSVPAADQTFTTKTVRFEDAPLSLEDLAGSICTCGVTFVEIPDPDGAPAYTVSATVTRFPDATLEDALLEGVQEIVPLVHVRVAEAAVPDIYLSDRRCTVDGQLYQPRLLRIGEPGSDVLMAQSIDGGTDEVQFALGNADRVMVQLANDTELKWATVELSLYHVQTGYLLNLWAGRIVDWSSDAGPEFLVQASDPLSALTLQSPVGTCSRSCWRRYALDGCPAVSGTQDLDTDSSHGFAGDASTCDLGYDTPNGCLAHSAGSNETKYYFGGTFAHPQKVRVLDNSTGTWGFGRDVITPTSQINDSLWGESLQEIWHNDDGIPQRGLPVTCRIAAGREESDFYIALGVVGRGPLGAFTTATMVDTDGDGTNDTFVGSTLDGQAHHGWKVDDSGNPTGTSLGLRQCLGTDPAGAEDYFSLGRVGSVPTSWREVTNGTSCYEDTYAAGVAFCEIRRVDEKGVQLSTPQSHSMIAYVSQGLTGLTWTAAGSRSTLAGCTNPFWVAVNTYLRALGLAGLTAVEQEPYFDVDAAIACAGTADEQVAPIFGTATTETQFRFKGVIDARKPCRDWLRDVLNNGLGYFTWSFGKLRLGVRIDARPVTNFHYGNILWNSLRLEPIKPAFEKLTVEFGDEEYLFAKNTVDYTDQDHAARNGRIQNPLTSTWGLVGCSTKSQAARLAVVRTREELGGVAEAEQKAARLASFKTTILALDTEAGMVVRLYDADLPGDSGKFRVQSWRLNRDWSVDIAGRTVTDSMYDLTTGTVPAATSEAAQPGGGVPGQDATQLFTVNGA